MKKASLYHDQNGLVSITVTLMFISIITLITISFAFMMRREQKQVLDRQLSTQAFYAAESGVNDAIADGIAGVPQEECSGTGDTLAEPVEYTCVLIEPEPSDIVLQEVPVDDSVVAKLQSNGAAISRVEIWWEAAEPEKKGLFAGNQHGESVINLPTVGFARPGTDEERGFSNNVGILRTTVIPIPSSISRATINNAAETYFLYPAGENIVVADGRTPQSIGYKTTWADSAFTEGDCTVNRTPRECMSEITGFSHSQIYIRLKSIYQPSNVVIRAFDSDNNQLQFSGGQAVIDATGKANDVLRRIQVRVRLNAGEYGLGGGVEYVLESMDSLCKRLVKSKDASNQDIVTSYCDD